LKIGYFPRDLKLRTRVAVGVRSSLFQVLRELLVRVL